MPDLKIERWQLRHNGRELITLSCWEDCLVEAVKRGLVMMNTPKSFVLKPWTEIDQRAAKVITAEQKE